MQRSPGMKLLFVLLIGGVLMVPLLLTYALVYDRQEQSQTAQQAINAGWGGAQIISGPLLVVPFKAVEQQIETSAGKRVTRAVEVERELFISPVTNKVTSRLMPQERRKSIYSSVLYEARTAGTATFALPDDLPRFGVTADRLIWDRAELRMGVSDARGLTAGGTLMADGERLQLQPGKGPQASGGEGFFAFVPWDGEGTMQVSYDFTLRGSESIQLVPRAGSTEWTVNSTWPGPSFEGAFLPDRRSVSGEGFSASYKVDKLALGQPPVTMTDYGAVIPPEAFERTMRDNVGGSVAMAIGLVEPVDLYSKVNRAVKYGFLFIGFTFLAFLLFDIVAGARIALAEYLLAGAGLVLFFTLLLAFAEVTGFAVAYLIASAAIIGLLTAYSAAILGSWRRAGVIGGLLTGLYAVLYVLLSLEAWSLLIGSVLLFAALAGLMYMTRKIDWSAVGVQPGYEER